MNVSVKKVYIVELSESEKQEMCGEIRGLSGCPVLHSLLEGVVFYE